MCCAEFDEKAWQLAEGSPLQDPGVQARVRAALSRDELLDAQVRCGPAQMVVGDLGCSATGLRLQEHDRSQALHFPLAQLAQAGRRVDARQPTRSKRGQAEQPDSSQRQRRAVSRRHSTQDTAGSHRASRLQHEDGQVFSTGEQVGTVALHLCPLLRTCSGAMRVQCAGRPACRLACILLQV